MSSSNAAVVGKANDAVQSVDYVVDITHLAKVFKRRTRAVSGYTTFKQALVARLKGKRSPADHVEEPGVTAGVVLAGSAGGLAGAASTGAIVNAVASAGFGLPIKASSWSSNRG